MKTAIIKYKYEATSNLFQLLVFYQQLMMEENNLSEDKGLPRAKKAEAIPWVYSTSDPSQGASRTYTCI